MVFRPAADRLYWLARSYRRNTLLDLWLLAITGEQYPEMADLMLALMRVERLVAVHQARLCGANVRHTGDQYFVDQPNWEESDQ